MVRLLQIDAMPMPPGEIGRPFDSVVGSCSIAIAGSLR